MKIFALDMKMAYLGKLAFIQYKAFGDLIQQRHDISYLVLYVYLMVAAFFHMAKDSTESREFSPLSIHQSG